MSKTSENEVEYNTIYLWLSKTSVNEVEYNMITCNIEQNLREWSGVKYDTTCDVPEGMDPVYVCTL